MIFYLLLYFLPRKRKKEEEKTQQNAFYLAYINPTTVNLSVAKLNAAHFSQSGARGDRSVTSDRW